VTPFEWCDVEPASSQKGGAGMLRVCHSVTEHLHVFTRRA